MSKRVKITDDVKASIRKAIGDEQADTDKFAVYEARFLSTEPLKKNGFFKGARVSPITVREMEVSLNKDGGAIPLHIMHEDRLLPVGKVFAGRTMTLPNGQMELRGLFYVPTSEKHIIDKIETSVVDEVSVGLRTKHAFCSKCSFDYLGPDASVMNMYTATCENEHTIGVDGAYVNLVGLDDWSELSLVGRGAANQAKILSRGKQNMSEDTAKRLAATGHSPEAGLLTASYSMNEPETNKGDKPMADNFTELLGKFETQTLTLAQRDTDLKASNDAIAALTAELTTLKASVTAKDQEITALKADDKGATISALTVKLTAAENELKAATEKLLPHVKAALVASGVDEKDLPATLSATVDKVVEKGLKLHQAVDAGNGGVAAGAKGGDEKQATADDPRKASFKMSK